LSLRWGTPVDQQAGGFEPVRSRLSSCAVDSHSWAKAMPSSPTSSRVARARPLRPAAGVAAAAEAMTARPMDKTQLLELLRLTARPAPEGWNERIGYGILDIPALFTTALPAVDPQEPNDDIDQVAAGQMFSTATARINGVGKSARLNGRVDAVEDPSDVYRVVVPAKRRLTVSYSANAPSLAVGLWSSSARSISSTAGLLASPNRATVAWRNSSARPRGVRSDMAC
jgi:hypothetical protein